MRRFFKASAVAALTALAGATLQVALVGPAQAAPKDYRDCPDRYLCLWGDASYTGRYTFYPDNNLFVPNIGDFMNDLTTSIWNRTSRRVCFYDDINYQRQVGCLDGGGSSANVGSGANDRISSFQAF